jgi:hypothetical protein
MVNERTANRMAPAEEYNRKKGGLSIAEQVFARVLDVIILQQKSQTTLMQINQRQVIVCIIVCYVED